MSDSDTTTELGRRLRRFAAHEAAGHSPLYEHLAACAADDPEVAGLLSSASGMDAHPTLFLAAAHRLIQAEPIHPLSRYYPSLGGLDGVDSQTWPLFRDFVRERADKMRALIGSRFTQTNEVHRAAVLFPAVAAIAARVRGPLGLLEVGCSAGLLLGMDTFGYHYQCDGGEQLTGGPAKAAVGLHCALTLEGDAEFPKLPKKLPVQARVGLDRDPVDASDEDELAWLEACVWADQPDRIRMLRTAAAAQSKIRPDLVAGDAVADLRSAAERVPAELPLVVYTSYAVKYLGEERQRDFIAALGELAADRAVWWVAAEEYESSLRHLVPGRDDVSYGSTARMVLGTVDWTGGAPRATLQALASPHGQRMRWFAE